MILHCIQPLRTDRNHANNSCPHLFKALTDCTCVRPHTIDCSYSRSITQLPRSWRSTNHNLTSFTQSIQRFDLLHAPALSLIKTDDFHVSATLTPISPGKRVVSLGPSEPSTSLHHRHGTRVNSASCLSSPASVARAPHRIQSAPCRAQLLRAEQHRIHPSHFVDIERHSHHPHRSLPQYALRRHSRSDGQSTRSKYSFHMHCQRFNSSGNTPDGHCSLSLVASW